MRRPPPRALAAVVLALEQAAVRAFGVDDAVDMQSPSVSPSYYTYVQHVQTSYDEAGTVQP
jgi:hypothetical protein